MVELKLNVSDVDYDSLLQALAGGVPGAVMMAARAMPDGAKEEMAVRYINANASLLESRFQQALAARGIRATISGAKATVVAE